MWEREFEIILYGATGFTGRQAVQYFKQNAPSGLRWAVSGRSDDKLQRLEAGVPVIVADSTDALQARALVSRTIVILSTAGPFELYSDQLVEACVLCRTHYVDITGEVAWVRTLIDRFHKQAEENGTRIVPFCGFDSVPSDLGVYLLTKKLAGEMAEAKAYFQLRGGRPNGGTFASAHRTYESGANKLGEDLFALSSAPKRALLPIESDPVGVRYDKDVNAWTAPFPMSIIDSRVVRRSLSLRNTASAYQEFIVFYGHFGFFWARLATTGTSMFYGALRSRFMRNLLRRMMTAGTGPSEKTMDTGFFACKVWGRQSNGATAEISLSAKGDPANRITVLCVCESAIAIANGSDDLPSCFGVLTPSTAIGDALVERLRNRGFTFEGC